MNSASEIRLATISDLPAIVEIYNQAIDSKSATGDTEVFKVEERLTWFEKFDAEKFPIYVAEYTGRIIGYATLSPYRPGRKAMEKIAEISFYLDYAYHGMGLGSIFVEHIISDCERLGKETLLAILLDINTASIRLLEKFNFEKWGHFPELVHLNGRKCGQLIYGLNLNNSL